MMGYNGDFKMMIQNVFTRKYIFLATTALFAFISAIMSLVDTVIGNLLHTFFPRYYSIFGSIYKHGSPAANWIWLFLIYMFICSLIYLGCLTVNKLKRTLSLCLGVIIIGFVLLIIALFRYVLPSGLVQDMGTFALRAMGFMGGGTINYFLPFLTFAVIISLVSLASYAVIRRIELR